MPEIFFHVDGDPRPQLRPRAFVQKTAAGPMARVYTPGTAEGWKSLIVAAAKPHLPSDPINSPVALQLAFYFERPHRLRRKKDLDGKIPCVGPRDDCDNLAKAVMDCLTQIRQRLRAEGFDFYDFRNPGEGDSGFSWREVDPAWQSWSPDRYVSMLDHPIARRGFEKDMRAMRAASTVLLVMPCGRSVHLEAGFALGAGKLGIILLDEKPTEPELMYRMAALITPSLGKAIQFLGFHEFRRWEVTQA